MKIMSLILGEIETNCYFLQNENTSECIIVDPADRADVIIQKVQELAVKPAAVFLTHGHWDHFLAAKEVAEHFWIPILCEEEEKEVLSDPDKNRTQYHSRGPVVLEPDICVKDGDEISYAGLTAEVLHTPGHTIGSCCYYFKEQHTLIAGDTMFCRGCGRTDLPTGSLGALYHSLKRLCLELPEETIVYPGHGPSTKIAYEKTSYDFKRKRDFS